MYRKVWFKKSIFIYVFDDGRNGMEPLKNNYLRVTGNSSSYFYFISFHFSVEKGYIRIWEYARTTTEKNHTHKSSFRDDFVFNLLKARYDTFVTSRITTCTWSEEVHSLKHFRAVFLSFWKTEENKKLWTPSCFSLLIFLFFFVEKTLP